MAGATSIPPAIPACQPDHADSRLLLGVDVPDASGVAVADFDGDGLLDFAVGSGSDGFTTWSAQRPGGRWSPPRLVAVGLERVGPLEAGDMDGDGAPDIVMGLWGTDSTEPGIVWYRNTGGPLPSFTLGAWLFRGGESISSIVLADMDMDGHLDVVASTKYEFTVFLNLAGDGRITSVSRAAYSTSCNNWSHMEAGAFASAAAPSDLLYTCINYGNSFFSVWANDGSGSFSMVSTTMLSGAEGCTPFSVTPSVVDNIVCITTSDLVGYSNTQSDGTDWTENFFSGDIFKDARVVATGFLVDNDGSRDIVVLDNDGPNAMYTFSFTSYPSGLSAPVLQLNSLDYFELWMGSDIAVADLNGDGREDMVATFASTGAYLVTLQTPAGAIDPVLPFLPFDQPYLLLSEDVDGDGYPDLLTSSESNNSAFIAFNSGDAGGNMEPWYPLFSTQSEDVQAMWIGDVAGDGGPLDVLWSENNGNLYYLRQPNGAPRTWAPPVVLAGGLDYESSNIDMGHLDADGHPDIVVTSPAVDKVLALMSSGPGSYAGTFTTITDAITNPTGLALADVDADADTDILVTSTHDSRIYQLLNNGSGTFAEPTAVVTGLQQAPVVRLADINSDGLPDLLGIGIALEQFGVRLNNPESPGDWKPFTQYPTGLSGARDMVVGSFAAPGSHDVAITFQSSVVFFQGIGSGDDFTFAHATSASTTSASRVALADTNLDGLDEIYWTRQWAYKIETLDPAVPTLDARFRTPVTIDHTLDDANGPVLDVGDVDGDGLPDLIEASSDEISWIPNTQEATTIPTRYPVANLPLGSNIHGIFLADVAGQGALDVVSHISDSQPTPTHTIQWHRNTDGQGSFQPSSSTVIHTTSLPTSVQVGQAVGSAALDVVVVANSSIIVFENVGGDTPLSAATAHTVLTGAPNTITLAVPYALHDAALPGILVVVEDASRVLWIAQPSEASWSAPVVISSALADPHAAAVAHLNGDAYPDLAVLTAAGTLALFQGTAGATPFATSASVIAQVSPAQHAELHAADIDGDGHTDLAFSFASFGDPNTGGLAWLANPGGGGAWSPPVFLMPAVPTVARIVDWNRDRSLDFVYAKLVGTTPRVSWLPAKVRSPSTGIRPATVSWSPAAHATRGAAHTSARALWQQMLQTSVCVHDTLMVPATTLDHGCFSLTQPHVNWQISVHGEGPASTRVDCGGAGALFYVSSQSSAQPAHLELAHMAIAGTSVAHATTRGSPGLFIDDADASLALHNVHASGCAAISSTGDVFTHEGTGACILVASGASALVNASSFADASTTNGGAITVSSSTSELRVLDTSFQRCTAAQTGGALLVDRGGALTLTGGSFSDCTASSGGAIALTLRATAVVDGATFTANTATDPSTGGGAITCARSELTLLRSTLRNNDASSGGGGGLLVDAGHCNATLDAVTLSGNLARYGAALAVVPSDVQGAVAVAGSASGYPLAASAVGVHAPLPEDLPAVRLNDVTVRGNRAQAYAGALWVCGAPVVVTGPATWSNNSEPDTAAGADVFLCGVAPAESPPVARTRAELPWVRVAAGAGASPALLESADVRGPIEALFWADTPSAEVFPGGSGGFSASVTARDTMNQTVVDPVEAIVVDSLDPAGRDVIYEIVGTSASAALDAASTAVPATSITVLQSSAIPYAITMRVHLSSDPAMGVEVTTQLTACPPGFGGIIESTAEANRTECAACAAGTFSAVTSFAGCLSVDGCPENQVNLSPGDATTDNTNCVCDDGFYLTGSDPATGQHECSACPAGGRCLRGLGPPFPAPGFFQTDNATFVACKRPNACPGGVERTCNPGYSGYMCNTCETGYYSDTTAACARCPGAAVAMLIVACVVVVGLGVLAAFGIATMVVRNVRHNVEVGEKLNEEGLMGQLDQTHTLMQFLRWRLIPPTLSMVLVAFQVVGILADANFAWTSASRSTLNIFNAANVDLNIIASECALSSFARSYALSVLLPLIGLLVVSVALVVLKYTCFREKMVLLSVPALIDAVVFAMAPLLYIPVSRAALVLFDCSKLPNGDYAVDSNPGVACFDAAWWSLAPLGAAVVALYVIILPLYCTLSLLAHSHELFDPLVFSRRGALYKLYRRPYFLGGVVELGKRLLLVLASVFFSSHQLIQFSILFVVLQSAFAAIVMYKPYYFPHHNSVDARLHAVLLVIVMVGVGSYAERDSGNSFDTFFLVVTIMAVVALVSIAAHAIVRDIWQTIRERNGKWSADDQRAQNIANFLEVEGMDVAAEPQLIALARRLRGHEPLPAADDLLTCDEIQLQDLGSPTPAPAPAPAPPAPAPAPPAPAPAPPAPAPAPLAPAPAPPAPANPVGRSAPSHPPPPPPPAAL